MISNARWRLAAVLVAVGAFASWLPAYADGHGSSSTIEVTPVPIGSAANLAVAPRGLEETAPPLPTDGLVPAGQRPAVRSRQAQASPPCDLTSVEQSEPAIVVVGGQTDEEARLAEYRKKLALEEAARQEAARQEAAKEQAAKEQAQADYEAALAERRKQALLDQKVSSGTPLISSGTSLEDARRESVNQDLTVVKLGTPILIRGAAPGDYVSRSPCVTEDGSVQNSPRWNFDHQVQAYEILHDRVQELQQLRRERQERLEEERKRLTDFQGPSALGAVNLLENLHVDRNVELFQNEVLDIANEVYFDANRETGVVYYLPRRYDLAWDPENQYALTVIYGLAGTTAGEGQVFMAARLRTGIDSHELEVGQALIRAYNRRHASTSASRFRELRPVPLTSTSDIELFGGAQNEFTVAADNISVQRVSGFLETVDVSWATNVRRLLNVESLLRTDAGIHGTTTFDTAGEEGFSRTIPIEINVTSSATFGRIRFDRANGWKNATPYPVKVHTLHALLLAPTNSGRVRKDDPVIYSWSLGDSVVPPGDALAWNAAAVPEWLDRAALLQWVDYSVDGSCLPCDEKVFSERFIPSLPKNRAVLFTTGDAFEATGAERITVHVRSPFLDPQRSGIVQLPGVRLSSDGDEYTVARLFLTDREFSPEFSHEPFYEWFLEVTMRDGRTYTSPDWSPSRSLDFLLGSRVIEESLGGRPWDEAGAAKVGP